MKHVLHNAIGLVFVLTMMAVAWAAGATFKPSADSGVQPGLPDVTDKKWPALAATKPAMLVYDAVEFADVAATATTPASRTWTSWRRGCRADTIVGFEQGRGDYADYVCVHLNSLTVANALTITADTFYCRGDLAHLLDEWTNATGSKTENCTFDETR